MNLILLHQDDFIGVNRVRLHGRRHKHAREVLCAKPGESLMVGLLGGKTGSGTIVSISERDLELAVMLDQDPPQALPVTLILAMPRPKVFKRVLQGITAMGVKHLIVINTWRVEKSYWQSPVLDSSVIHEQLVLGLEQARDTILPQIQIQPRFKPFVEDTLPGIAAGTCALVAHPDAAHPCPNGDRQEITLAIGPEGGFTNYEVDKLIAAGLLPVYLGNRPLRVETAIPALLGRFLPCP